MSAQVHPIDMRFPGEPECKRDLRKRLLAVQVDAATRSGETGSGFAWVELNHAAQFAGRWATAEASEQQLQDALIGLAGQLIAANAFERAADGRVY